MAGWGEQAEGQARPQSPAPLCGWVVAFTGHRGSAHTSQWLPQSHWGHSHRGAGSACCLGLNEQPINTGQGRADRTQIREAALELQPGPRPRERGGIKQQKLPQEGS